ncbi:transcriptional regulator [Streptomyces sp. NPDC050485]|uniref:transcriptional regulator n=1 Tax=Streptomyces sp. NPDC050485 TaxID=3365617 RepID=UPI0037981DFE
MSGWDTCTANDVYRWETGRRTPGPWLPHIVIVLALDPDRAKDTWSCTLPDQDPVPAGNPARHNDAPEGLDGADDMNRRDFLGLVSVTGTLIALHPGGPGTPEAATNSAAVTTYELLNGHLWQVFALSQSKQAVYPVVRHQLKLLTQELERARTEATHRALCAHAGELFQLAGEIFFDGNRYTDAAHCYALAASASKEAGEYDLWACALTRHAFIGLYERQFSAAVPMLAAAAAVARRGNSQLSTRYWVAAVQAEAFAGLGDLDACNRALDTAEQVHSLNGPVHNGGWLRFDGSRLAARRGARYLLPGPGAPRPC